MKHTVCVVTAIVFGLLCTSGWTAPRLQTGPDAEVTHDGLYRVDKTVMSAAWIKPDIDLRGYDKLMIVGTGFSYRTVDNEGKRYSPGRSNDSDFYIAPKNRERIETEMREAFTRELVNLDRYKIVSDPAPDVLMLVGGVIDVVSSVPPVDTCVNRCDVYLSKVGEATLVLELRDSMSNEILARAVDRGSGGLGDQRERCDGLARSASIGVVLGKTHQNRIGKLRDRRRRLSLSCCECPALQTPGSAMSGRRHAALHPRLQPLGPCPTR